MSYKVDMWFILVPGTCGTAPKGTRNTSLPHVLFYPLKYYICIKFYNIYAYSCPSSAQPHFVC